jgi:hypothetical protein
LIKGENKEGDLKKQINPSLSPFRKGGEIERGGFDK